MFKKLAVSAIASAILFIPSVASAKWVEVSSDQIQGYSFQIDKQKITRDGDTVYYWYQTVLDTPTYEGVKKIAYNVAADCSLRNQRTLEVVYKSKTNKILGREKFVERWEQKTSYIMTGTHEELLFFTACSAP